MIILCQILYYLYMAWHRAGPTKCLGLGDTHFTQPFTPLVYRMARRVEVMLTAFACESEGEDEDRKKYSDIVFCTADLTVDLKCNARGHFFFF